VVFQTEFHTIGVRRRTFGCITTNLTDTIQAVDGSQSANHGLAILLSHTIVEANQTNTTETGFSELTTTARLGNTDTTTVGQTTTATTTAIGVATAAFVGVTVLGTDAFCAVCVGEANTGCILNTGFLGIVATEITNGNHLVSLGRTDTTGGTSIGEDERVTSSLATITGGVCPFAICTFFAIARLTIDVTEGLSAQTDTTSTFSTGGSFEAATLGISVTGFACFELLLTVGQTGTVVGLAFAVDGSRQLDTSTFTTITSGVQAIFAIFTDVFGVFAEFQTESIATTEVDTNAFVTATGATVVTGLTGGCNFLADTKGQVARFGTFVAASTTGRVVVLAFGHITDLGTFGDCFRVTNTTKTFALITALRSVAVLTFCLRSFCLTQTTFRGQAGQLTGFTGLAICFFSLLGTGLQAVAFKTAQAFLTVGCGCVVVTGFVQTLRSGFDFVQTVGVVGGVGNFATLTTRIFASITKTVSGDFTGFVAGTSGVFAVRDETGEASATEFLLRVVTLFTIVGVDGADGDVVGHSGLDTFQTTLRTVRVFFTGFVAVSAVFDTVGNTNEAIGTIADIAVEFFTLGTELLATVAATGCTVFTSDTLTSGCVFVIDQTGQLVATNLLLGEVTLVVEFADGGTEFRSFCIFGIGRDTFLTIGAVAISRAIFPAVSLLQCAVGDTSQTFCTVGLATLFFTDLTKGSVFLELSGTTATTTRATRRTKSVAVRLVTIRLLVIRFGVVLRRIFVWIAIRLSFLFVCIAFTSIRCFGLTLFVGTTDLIGTAVLIFLTLIACTSAQGEKCTETNQSKKR
jgi:hypothetical protein